jgi:hypothetical protein
VPNNAKVFISLVTAAGLAAIVYAFLNSPLSHDRARFCTYLLLSLLATTLKLRLPGLTSTMSLGFVLVLLGISELTLPETMLMACTGTGVQCLWKPKARPAPVQVVFSVSAVAISLVLAYECSHFVRTQFHAEPVSIVLAVATCLYFMANSLLVSGVVALTKNASLRDVWQQCYLFAIPCYLLGGAVAGLMAASGRDLGWQPPLLILPVMALAFLFYHLYLTRLEMLTAPDSPAPSLDPVKARSAIA